MSEEEERMLLDRLMALDLAPFRFHGWLGKRRTRSFGWRYDFDDSSFTRSEPLPAWLLPLRGRAAKLARVAADDVRSGAHRALRSRRGDRLASRPRRIRASRRHLAERARDAALPPEDSNGLQAHQHASRASLRLPSFGRGAAQLGAQHRTGPPAAFLHHFPHAVREGPSDRPGGGADRPLAADR